MSYGQFQKRPKDNETTCYYAMTIANRWIITTPSGHEMASGLGFQTKKEMLAHANSANPGSTVRQIPKYAYHHLLDGEIDNES